MPILFKLSAQYPVSHFLQIEMIISEIDSEEILIDLPSWRPGRYELGNFAKNVRSWRAYNNKNESLAFRKTTKDTWQVSTEGASTITIRYDYYCSQPDAGGCWVDEDQIYINPVQCLMFPAGRISESSTIELSLPPNYIVATSLSNTGNNVFSAIDFHELYDSPLIASASLQLQKYKAGNSEFFVWFQGNCKPEWDKIIRDFIFFSREQYEMMGDFPFTNYHFLIQILPYRFYHGVEHLNSTVLALGPGQELMNDSLYIDFIGVASHELFHAWNIKTIRPADMLPYDYKSENYSRLGFVYEGVTTYYGDLFLARCGVYSVDQFFKEISVRLQKHFDNPGRFNLSVADSSFDTWLDGYTPGAPGRKTSIYDEGCLTALMTDLLIRKATDSVSSLDDVMKTLYVDFGKRGIGYSEHDYISIVEHFTKKPMADFFLDHVYGTEEYKKLLEELLSEAGCLLVMTSSTEETERTYGFKTAEEGGYTVVSSIMPGSPAFIAGLGKGDEIIAVNENKVEENISAYFKMFKGEKVILTILTPMKALKDIPLSPSSEEYYQKFSIRKKDNATMENRKFFKAWLKQEFEESEEQESRIKSQESRQKNQE